MQNWDQTLLSQYANSPIINALVESFNDAIDPAANIAAFQQYIWNIDTAVGYGLTNVWGKIVGVSRTIKTLTGTLTLQDQDYRTLILVKAAANIGNVTIPTLNKLISQIFATFGAVYVEDGLNMSITYVFTFAVTPAQYAIVTTSGVLPRPAGVQANISVPGTLFNVSDNVSDPLFIVW